MEIDIALFFLTKSSKSFSVKYPPIFRRSLSSEDYSDDGDLLKMGGYLTEKELEDLVEKSL